MKSKTIDKILVKLDEIASIVKQAKKEGIFNTHDDGLDFLARALESYKIDYEDNESNLKVEEVSEEEKELLKEKNHDIDSIKKWYTDTLEKIEKEHKGDFSSGYRRMKLVEAFASGYARHIDYVFRRNLRKLKSKEQSEINSDLPKDYSLEEFTKFKKFLTEQNSKPSEEVKEESKRKKVVPEILVSEDDILTPTENHLVFDRKDLYNAIIHMKELYKEHFNRRVFNYTEIDTIITVFKSSVRDKWCGHINVNDDRVFNEAVRTHGGMFTSGWYNYLALNGICQSDGIRAVTRLKEKGIFYQLLASMLAVEEKVEKDSGYNLFTRSYDYSSLSYADFDSMIVSSWKFYRLIVTGLYGSELAE